MKTRAPGFTLIELMAVIAIIAIASAVTALALRDPAATRLEHEAARLVALLEAARTEARGAGLSASWQPLVAENGASSFRFVGMPPSEESQTQWLTSGVTADIPGARAILLGPEPLIGAQRSVLRLDQQTLTLSTDGLGPFVVDPGTAAP